MSDSVPPPLPYKPSAFYFRRRLRATDDPEKLRKLGMSLVSELEHLKAWVREQGLIPPKWAVLREEAEEKGWLDQG
ncbi:hypothetical protein OpiT1DRAFT_01258 [Opitutaceae bacterium TAV1]|nr:hypothetical protein OpiT1DRAFT_01258 [Opitutaceae bacterium TAV1]